MKDYYKKLKDSVYSISMRQQLEFGGGQGGELKSKYKHGKVVPAKMLARYSSSALAVNMLGVADSLGLGADYWDSVFGLRNYFHGRNVECHFEKHLKVSGVRGFTPNLDFYIEGGERFLGVESKYREMYARKRKQVVQEQYLEKFPYWGEWKDLRRTAEKVDSYAKLGRLDAAQLIKHSLALISAAEKVGTAGKFRLLYLYHDVLDDESVRKEHLSEIRRFAEESGLGRHFIPLPYSRYVKRMETFRKYFDADYLPFIHKRYAL